MKILFESDIKALKVSFSNKQFVQIELCRQILSCKVRCKKGDYRGSHAKQVGTKMYYGTCDNY